ncbi:hypothetical protein [Pseudomonas aeruginosa]
MIYLTSAPQIFARGVKNEQEQADMLQFAHGVFYERGLRAQALRRAILVQ